MQSLDALDAVELVGLLIDERSPFVRAEAHVQLGHRALRDRRPEVAHRHFSEAAALVPHHRGAEEGFAALGRSTGAELVPAPVGPFSRWLRGAVRRRWGR